MTMGDTMKNTATALTAIAGILSLGFNTATFADAGYVAPAKHNQRQSFHQAPKRVAQKPHMPAPAKVIEPVVVERIVEKPVQPIINNYYTVQQPARAMCNVVFSQGLQNSTHACEAAPGMVVNLGGLNTTFPGLDR
jgi:hypothetical protein